MQRTVFSPKLYSAADLLILLLVATGIYALVSMGNEWRADYHPVTVIDLSLRELPKYVLLSAMRGVAAYAISLAFTLVVGYTAAKSAAAERIILPMLDILQSIPVLGFLPGLVLGLIALFPNSNIGLELAAIIMIFTGQVWNMTFSFYNSLKSMPTDLNEASTVIGMDWAQKLRRVELPCAAVNLAWNSLLSMAGGWFFLSICEAFTLGNREFRLPGIGSYMALAIAEGNVTAMVSGVIAMVLLIVIMDFVIWQPILSWVQRFRLEEVSGAATTEPLMRIVFRESRLLRWMKLFYRRYLFEHRMKAPLAVVAADPGEIEEESPLTLATARTALRRRSLRLIWRALLRTPGILKFFRTFLGVLVAGVIYYSVWQLFKILIDVQPLEWVVLLRNTFWTFLRIFLALALATLWAVPFGIWIGTSARRIRVAQPIILILASFPAPMLFPLAIAILFKIGMNFNWASMFLMLLSVQWYVLFNVLAGALRIPRELDYALSLMESSTWDRWRTLYLPSVFPALVTGWVNAAGGAWNASIVAEYLVYRGEVFQTSGLGSTISMVASRQDFRLLAASLSIMVIVVVGFNRVVWAPVYRMAQTRFRLDI